MASVETVVCSAAPWATDASSSVTGLTIPHADEATVDVAVLVILVRAVVAVDVVAANVPVVGTKAAVVRVVAAAVHVVEVGVVLDVVIVVAVVIVIVAVHVVVVAVDVVVVPVTVVDVNVLDVIVVVVDVVIDVVVVDGNGGSCAGGVFKKSEKSLTVLASVLPNGLFPHT